MKRSKHSILSRQRPAVSQKRRSRIKKFILIVGTVSLVALMSASGIVKLVDSFKYQTASRQPIKPKTWEVQVDVPDAAEYSEKKKDTIRSNLMLILQQADDEDSLEIAAKSLQKQFEAEKVTLVQTEPQKLVVQLVPRKAVLRIKADRVRLLTANGQVYGKSTPQDDATLPLLYGIFSEREIPFSLGEDSTLVLDPEERELLTEAVTLLGQAKQFGYEPKALEYVKYRGFVITTKKDDIEISIGRAPFNGQLRQLSEILKNLKKNGSQALRIELDYKGKAFIKEKEG